MYHKVMNIPNKKNHITVKLNSEVGHWRTDAFELWCWRRLFESPLDCQAIKLVTPKGNHPWIYIGRTDAKAETLILWPSDVKNWLIGKDPDAGKDWRWEKKGTTENEMVGWHHQLDAHKLKQAPGGGDGREAWRAAVHEVTKSWTWLSDWIEQWSKDTDYVNLSTRMANKKQGQDSNPGFDFHQISCLHGPGS